MSCTPWATWPTWSVTPPSGPPCCSLAVVLLRLGAGEAAHSVLHLSGGLSCRVLGLVRHLTGLIRSLIRHVLRLTGDLSGGALRLIGHPAQSTIA